MSENAIKAEDVTNTIKTEEATPTLEEFTANILATQENNVLNVYRDQDELGSDTDSDESDIVIKPASLEEDIQEDDPKTKKFGPTAKGELTLDDLPPVEKLKITVPLDHLEFVGEIYSFVDRLVIVESAKGDLVLNLDTVLFLEDGRSVGQVFDVIGPVKKPYYVLRFNNPQEIQDEHLEQGVKIFCAPTHADYTFFVFEKQIKEMMNSKGSDASWEHDVEPPEHELDYSDDEQEREAKKERKAKRQANGNPVEKKNAGRPQRKNEYRQNSDRHAQPGPQYPIPHQHPAYRNAPSFHPNIPPPGYNPWAHPSMAMPPPNFGYPLPPYAFPPLYTPPYGPPQMPNQMQPQMQPQLQSQMMPQGFSGPVPYTAYQTKPQQ